MYIGKPIRIIGGGCVTGLAVGLVVRLFKRHIGLWVIPVAVVTIPISYFVAEVVINAVDMSLRKWTRDPIWGMQHERNKKK